MWPCCGRADGLFGHRPSYTADGGGWRRITLSRSEPLWWADLRVDFAPHPETDPEPV